MTVIIGLETSDGVVLIGDSCASESQRHSRHVVIDPKVFRKGEMVIGYTWSFRMGDVLKYQFEAPVYGANSPKEYLVCQFVPALRACFKEHGIMGEDNKRDEGGDFLVGLRGQLFMIASDFSVLRYERGYAAIGGGGEIALGAMAALEDLKPIVRLRRAMEATATLYAYIQPPYTLVQESDVLSIGGAAAD